MIRLLQTSFELSNTYTTNSVLYNLKHIPFLERLVPSSIYQKKFLFTIIHVLVFAFSILMAFVKMTLYFMLLVWLPSLLLIKDGNSGSFLTMFLFLTLGGAFCNTKILEVTKKKYYNLILMRMNEREYTRAHLLLAQIKNCFLFSLFLLFSSFILSFPWWYAFVLPLFVVSLKMLGEWVDVCYCLKKGKAFSQNIICNLAVGFGSLVIAYLLPYFSFHISPLLFFLVLPLVILLGCYCFFKLWNCKRYSWCYQRLLTPNMIFFHMEANQVKVEREQVRIRHKDIAIGSERMEGKHGYAYFNSLFFERHKSLLLRSALRYAAFFFLVIVFLSILLFLEFKVERSLHHILLNCLPYFVFIMYFTNRGQLITQAMFFNCDHSMLTYNFYRSKIVILNVFKLRLKTLVKINLIPAVVLAVGLPILLWLSGGSALPWDYLGLFLSFLFLSIFFSLHHLVIYYLLQPYNANMQTKSPLFSIVNWITYIGCYFCVGLRVSTSLFSLGIILATVGYIVLSLFLVYRYAAKTFKIK